MMGEFESVFGYFSSIIVWKPVINQFALDMDHSFCSTAAHGQ